MISRYEALPPIEIRSVVKKTRAAGLHVQIHEAAVAAHTPPGN
jgi:hypothetical protein